MTVVVRFSADQAPYAREGEWHPTQTLRELRAGRVELTFRAGGTFENHAMDLGVGGCGGGGETFGPTPGDCRGAHEVRGHLSTPWMTGRVKWT